MINTKNQSGWIINCAPTPGIKAINIPIIICQNACGIFGYICANKLAPIIAIKTNDIAPNRLIKILPIMKSGPHRNGGLSDYPNSDPASIDSGKNVNVTLPSFSADRIIPSDNSPIILRGFKLATNAMFLPTSSVNSG